MARSISRLARIWFDREGAVVAGAEEVEAAVEAVVVAWTAEMGITVAGVAVAWPAAGVAAGVAVAKKAACPPSCVGKTGLRTRDPLGSIMESRAWRMVFLWRSVSLWRTAFLGMVIGAKSKVGARLVAEDDGAGTSGAG